MTEDLIRRLMAAGLTKQQASSVTAETLVNLFMPDDGKVLIREAQGQVAEMRQLVNDLRKEYAELKRKIEGLSDTLLAISEAQKEHGVITDEKARNVVALYAALLTMGEKAGADAEDGPPQTYTWATDGALRTEYSTHNTGECPSAENASFLSRILQAGVPRKYYLTAKACQGILRRASVRGKELPTVLRLALERQAKEGT